MKWPRRWALPTPALDTILIWLVTGVLFRLLFVWQSTVMVDHALGETSHRHRRETQKPDPRVLPSDLTVPLEGPDGETEKQTESS